MPSATFADSRLSNAASSATANAAENSSLIRSGETAGNDGAGKEPGSFPIRETDRSGALGDDRRGHHRKERRGQRPVNSGAIIMIAATSDYEAERGEPVR